VRWICKSNRSSATVYGWHVPKRCAPFCLARWKLADKVQTDLIFSFTVRKLTRPYSVRMYSCPLHSTYSYPWKFLDLNITNNLITLLHLNWFVWFIYPIEVSSTANLVI
jgi:hypothetical protein